MDVLNTFVPYGRVPPQHENQLTRALLVVLRLCPMAHAAWLRRVDSNLALPALPPAEFYTQKREIPLDSSLPSDEQEWPRVVSVLLSPNTPVIDEMVRESNRRQVLDGIIDYMDVIAILEGSLGASSLLRRTGRALTASSSGLWQGAG